MAKEDLRTKYTFKRIIWKVSLSSCSSNHFVHVFFDMFRSKNQIFFTWNQSNKQDLDTFLQSIQDQQPKVQFEYLIGSKVSYLNAFIENRNGKLFTSIYHHPILQSYTLPYVLHHTEVAHSNWLRMSLLRAICLCTSVEDFHLERIYLELTYLANGYSLTFVGTHLDHFFYYFQALEMRCSNDQTKYDKFRHDCLNYMKIQHQRSDELQQANNKGQVIRLHYIYEYGPRCEFNNIFHRLWLDYFKEHPTLSKEKVEILLSTRHRYSLNSLLTRDPSSLSL